MVDRIGRHGGVVGTKLWNDEEPDGQPMIFGSWRLNLRGAEIADLSFAGRPVLRGLRFVVRDHDWRTADNDVITLRREDDELSLTVSSSFDGHPVIDWTATVSFRDDTVRYVAEARVTSSFRRNRAGLVVLHEPGLAGTPLDVLQPDGRTRPSAFPQTIAPHQPAQQVAGYRWSRDGVDCTLRLSGDVFEMEDQRNWTDASYKTYSCPLSEPFPVTVEAGQRIDQAAELSCAIGGNQPAQVTLPPKQIMIIPDGTDLPMLQVGAATAPDAPAVTTLDDFPLLVEVPADEPYWPAILERAGRDTLGELDVRIIAAGAEQLPPVIKALAVGPLAERVVRVGVFGRGLGHLTEGPMLRTLQAALNEVHLTAEVVAGTRANFTELNRNIAAFDDWPGALTFSVTPQLHDRSRAQLIESLQMQRIVAEQAVGMAAGRPLHVGPVTLRPRFNAVATTRFRPSRAETLAAGYGPQHVPDATDPRQHAPATAAWTVVSVAALAVPGVSSITYFECWGGRGLRPSPNASLSSAGQVLDWLRAGGRVIPAGIEISDPTETVVGCIAQQSAAARQLVIGNLGPDDAFIRIPNLPAVVLDPIGEPSTIMERTGEVGDSSAVLLRVPAASTVRLRSSTAT